MIQIRRSIFETNSSSVHSMTMCSQDEYDKWRNGELYFNNGLYEIDDQFITFEQAKKIIEEKRVKWYSDEIGNPIDDEVLEAYDVYSHDAFWNKYEEWYETFFEKYTTESCETVIAFGYFGNDY